MNGLPGHVKKHLASHFRGFDLDRIQIRTGIPRHVRMVAAIDPRAYASGNILYFSEGVYDPRSKAGIALIGHEVMHCRQYSEFGTWRFHSSKRRAGCNPSSATISMPNPPSRFRIGMFRPERSESQIPLLRRTFSPQLSYSSMPATR